MKFLAIIFNAVFLSSFLCAASEIPEPSSPLEPQISDPVVPSPISLLSNSLIKTNQAVMKEIGVDLKIQESTNIRGIWILSNIPTFVITNQSSNSIEIHRFSLRELSEIRILKWQAEIIKDNLYRFYPILFELISPSKNFRYQGRIKEIESIQLKQSKKKYFTLFFDRWKKGEKALFHWKNSQTDLFNYPFYHPLKGVVVSIRINPLTHAPKDPKNQSP